MPPKSVRAAAPRAASRGYIAATYDILTSREYSSVVRSIGAFGVGVAFLMSPMADYLLPQ